MNLDEACRFVREARDFSDPTSVRPIPPWGTPQWGRVVATEPSEVKTAAAAVVDGEGYIAPLATAFEAVFDSLQELHELAENTPLRALVQSELLPERVQAMKADIHMELNVLMSSAFPHVYQSGGQADAFGATCALMKDSMFGCIIKHIVHCFKVRPLEVPQALQEQFQLAETNRQQEQRRILLLRRHALNSAIRRISNPSQSLSGLSTTSRGDLQHTALALDSASSMSSLGD